LRVQSGLPVNSSVKQAVDLIVSCGLLFTAQPKAPAYTKAGAFGWAVNDEINNFESSMRTGALLV